jgi:CRP-like cAMP-binding protein/rhodanese-related sulfurtransferase
MSEDKEKYVQQIRQLTPISDLSPQGQTEIINSSTLLKLKKKGTLFKQGDRDNFSFYLLDGEIELHANKQQQNVIVSGTDRALYAMAQLQPRQFSAKAKTESMIFQIQRDTLDRLMVLQEKDDTGPDSGIDVESSEMEVSDLGEEDDVDWMTRMLQSELFSRMPTANIGQLFALLEEVEFKTGDLVIKQGDPGDKYYIIQEGTCHVLRTPPSGGKDLKLAVLGAGDSFGEEALVSESIRNATIAMATDGVLMELSKDNFIELIKKPTLQSVSYDDATALVEAGAIWLDVRFKKEHDSHAIPDSLHIPLNILRMQADKLEQGKKYIVYCDTGGRSSTGAFLLAERGFEVSYLEGGIVNNPDAADESEVTQAPPPPPPPVKKAPPPKPAAKAEPEAQSKDVVEEISKQNLDPDIKASVLEAELSRTNMQLEEVEKAKLQADKSIQDAQAEVEKQLQEERAKIEVAKKQAEEEAIKLRQKEEEKVKLMKVEAEKRLQEEKKKLEAVYSRNAEEMEKIEQMKQEAEASVLKERERLAEAAEDAKKQMEAAEAMKNEMEASRQKESEEAKKQLEEAEVIKKEIEASRQKQIEDARKNIEEAEALKKEMEALRQKEAEEARKQKEEAEALKKELEISRQKETEEARKQMEEAQRLKAEVEASRLAMEKAAEERRKEQEEMEKKIQQVAKAKLEEERRKLSEEFARNNDDLEKAKRERAEAEAARQAAKDEAGKIIAEYKMTHDKSHAEEEAKLKAERLKLEEEQRKIQESLLEVKKAKEEAEAAKQAALREVEQLRTKQNEELAAADVAEKETISVEIKQAEEKISKAAIDIVHAQQAEMKAVAAKNINEVDIQKKKQMEEELHKQMQADLSQFRHEKDEEEKAYADSSTIMEKMRRIKESAEAAKKTAKAKDVGLLDDIAAQLGNDD